MIMCSVMEEYSGTSAFIKSEKSVLDAQASQEEMVFTDSETDWHIKTKSPRSPRSHRSLRSPRSKNKKNEKKKYIWYIYIFGLRIWDLGFGELLF